MLTDVFSFHMISFRFSLSKTTEPRSRFTSDVKIDFLSSKREHHNLLALLPRSSFTIRNWINFHSISSRLSSQPTYGNNDDDTKRNLYKDEETLLCLRLKLKNSYDGPKIDAVDAISSYCQSFPYAVVLPVQPLMYTPTKDDEGTIGGVEIKFLRKKTEIKSSVDGGIRFFLQYVTDESIEDEDEDDNDALDSTLKVDTNNTMLIEIIAKRNSKG
jgi:hypothetical protein